MKNDLNLDNMIEEGCLITAGNINDYNTMTIGWGMKGIIWRRKTFIAYVKPCRYTYEFMEKNDYFTISFYEKDYKKQMAILGTLSGRDCNKVEQSGLTPIEVDSCVTFKEAYYTLICKKYYYHDIEYNKTPDDAKERYYQDKNCMHRVYYGEIIKEIKN